MDEHQNHQSEAFYGRHHVPLQNNFKNAHSQLVRVVLSTLHFSLKYPLLDGCVGTGNGKGTCNHWRHPLTRGR